MPNTNEGAPAPDSIEAKAIAELEKEGHVITTDKPEVGDDGIMKDKPAPSKEEVKVEEKPKEEAPKEEPKPDRTPTMVEAWKLKVAEDQKAGLEKDLVDLKAKVEELSKQKGPVTQAQKDDLSDEIKTIAEEAGVDAGFLTKFADTILKKAESKRPSGEVEKTIQTIQAERELEKQLNAYGEEFEKDVAPLVKEYNLSDQALSQLKGQLRDLAFSETYAKVPLKEIFRIKEEGLGLKAPKRSSESKGVKTRTNEVVDITNLDEDSFSKLTPEQVEKFAQSQVSSGWNKPSSERK